jgi:adenosylhomocysteine nucleosidase
MQCKAWLWHRPNAPALVAESGPGAKRTAQALDYLLGDAPSVALVSCVISAGFAGGLREGFAVGDTILASEILDVNGGRWRSTWPVDLASRGDLALHRGRLLTAPGIIATPAEKRRLGQEHDAVAVDMESAIVAQRCADRAIPFGALRAVSDPVEMGLSEELMSLFRHEMPPVSRAAGALWNKPALLGEMWRLARNTRLAARRLAAALNSLLAAPVHEARQ